MWYRHSVIVWECCPAFRECGLQGLTSSVKANLYVIAATYKVLDWVECVRTENIRDEETFFLLLTPKPQVCSTRMHAMPCPRLITPPVITCRVMESNASSKSSANVKRVVMSVCKTSRCVTQQAKAELGSQKLCGAPCRSWLKSRRRSRQHRHHPT